MNPLFFFYQWRNYDQPWNLVGICCHSGVKSKTFCLVSYHLKDEKEIGNKLFIVLFLLLFEIFRLQIKIAYGSLILF